MGVSPATDMGTAGVSPASPQLRYCEKTIVRAPRSLRARRRDPMAGVLVGVAVSGHPLYVCEDASIKTRGGRGVPPLRYNHLSVLKCLGEPPTIHPNLSVGFFDTQGNLIDCNSGAGANRQTLALPCFECGRHEGNRDGSLLFEGS